MTSPTPAVLTVRLRSVLEVIYIVLMMLVIAVLTVYHASTSQTSWASGYWFFVIGLAGVGASASVMSRLMQVSYDDGYAAGYAAANRDDSDEASAARTDIED